MNFAVRMGLFLAPLAAAVALVCCSAGSPLVAAPKPDTYWQVDDVRAGMKGVGRTVMKGTKVETFDAEVLGVLKNTSPGRDMVLCRLSGLGPGKDRRHRRHERQPGLHRRQAARRRGLCLALRQGADRRHHAVLPDARLRRGLRAPRPGRAGQADPRRPARRRCASTARTSTPSPSRRACDDPAADRRRTACGWCRCGRRWPPPASRRTA